MYWREIYPTHEAAANAERLGDLGKVKLSPTQKAAIQAAKADAKVAAVKAKSQVQAARVAAKTAKISQKQALTAAKYQTKIAAQTAKQASYAPQAVSAPASDTSLIASESPMQFLPAASGGGGGGGFVPEPVAQESSLSLPLILAGVGVLALLLFFRK